jgi:heptosyltransferase-2
MKPLDPADVRRLVVRAPNWLGDSVMALPTLRSLRAGIPGARITVVGAWAELFADQGVADEFVAYPRSLAERVALAPRIRAFRPDLALLLPNSFEAALASRVWGAPLRVGFATDRRAWLLTHRLPRPAPRPHQIDEYLELLRALDLPPAETAPAWARVPSADDAAVSRLLEEAGLAGGSQLVGLHLGAAFGSSKLWPVDHWALLAAELERAGLAPVLLGSRAELRVAAEVLKRCPARVPSLVGRDTPALLPRLLSRLSLLVSGDTGVAQLAAAVDLGVVTLFGPTDPRLTAPRGERVRVLMRPVPCAPCFLRVCPIDHPCMRGIGVGEVLAASLALARSRR